MPPWGPPPAAVLPPLPSDLDEPPQAPVWIAVSASTLNAPYTERSREYRMALRRRACQVSLGLAIAALAGACRNESAAEQRIELTLETDLGAIHCTLEPRHAPRAVALFVGFATGRSRWLDPATRRETDRPMYRDLPITRAIPNVYIQSGDPVGDGSGHPGYRIEVEAQPHDAERLRRPGALVLARYTPPPGRSDPNPPPAGRVLGSQFAVLLTDMSHLAGSVSVLGSCRDLELARRISVDVGAHRRARRLRRVSVP